MIEDKNNKGIVSLLFDSLNQEKISYLVLRNYKELPEKPLEGSDIDLLISRKDEEKYLLAFKKAISESGSRILLKIRQSNCLSFFIYQKNPNFIATWIDAFWEISNKSFVFADSKFLLENRIRHEKGFFIPPLGGESATLFIKDALTLSFIQERYRSKIKDLVKEGKENFIKTLKPYFKEKVIKEMFRICLNEKWEEVAKKRKNWWRSLVLNSFSKKPFIQTLKFLDFSFSQLKKFITKKGIIIAVIGPDGVGKTTICQSLKDKLDNFYFREFYQYHSHFGLFPELGKIYQRLFRKSISEDNLSQENKIGAFRAILHLFYYGLENFLAWPLIFWLKIRGNLIIFDRYFYDFIAANTNSKFALWLFWQIVKIIPHPDILFVFKASPEKIYERKKELSLGEIKRQLEAFQNSKISKITSTVFINNEEKINVILEKIEDEIIKALAKKYNN